MKKRIILIISIFLLCLIVSSVLVMLSPPQSERDRYLRGTAYYREGKYDRAISELTKAIEMNPGYEQAYHNRGIAYYRKGEHELAISDFTKAIELGPRYAKAYYNRGNVYNNKGKYDLAISDYTKAIEINPGCPDINLVAGIYCNRGRVYVKNGEHDLAISDLSKALEYDPLLAIAYDYRAMSYNAKGQYDKAQEDVQKRQSLGVQDEPEFLKALPSGTGTIGY